MAYCYQCIGCVTDLECPPDEDDAWCVKKLISVNYKDEGCDRFEWSKTIKKSGSKDDPSLKFDSRYGKYNHLYFRYNDEPNVIYRLIKCMDSLIVYTVSDDYHVLPKVKILNTEYVNPEGKVLESSLDCIAWVSIDDMDDLISKVMNKISIEGDEE